MKAVAPARHNRPLGVAAAAVPRGGVVDLALLHPRLIWRYLKTQPASFWLVNIYIFFEYVRPQQIYSAMGGFPYAQASLYLAFGAFLYEGARFRKLLVTDFLLILYSLVLLVSCVAAASPATSYAALPLFINWLLIYVLVVNIVGTEKRYLVLMLAWLLYSFKMSQHGARVWIERGFGFAGWGASGAPGWFQNSGEFGIQMAMFMPIAAYFTMALRRHWGRKTLVLFWAMVATSVMSVIASSSRGALIALGGAVLWMVLQSGNKVKGAILAALLAILVLFALPQEFRDRFDTIGDDRTSIARDYYWSFSKEIMREHPVLGVGYGGWANYFERANGYSALPHNIFYQAGAEMGYLGLGAFLALIGGTLWLNWRTRRLMVPLGENGRLLRSLAYGLDAAMIAFLIGGTFVTVLYYPFFWINLALTTSLHHAALDTLMRARKGHAARLVPAA